MKKAGLPKKMVAEERKEAMEYAKGGSASARADGIAQRGKTRGMLLKKGGMAYGGKC